MGIGGLVKAEEDPGSSELLRTLLFVSALLSAYAVDGGVKLSPADDTSSYVGGGTSPSTFRFSILCDKLRFSRYCCFADGELVFESGSF